MKDKNLYDPGAAEDFKRRVMSLTPDRAPVWGKMRVGQMVAHLANALEMAIGERRPSRMLIGRIVGPAVKKRVMGNDDPLRMNTPTSPVLHASPDSELAGEQARLIAAIDRFVVAGPAGCTDHPHTFFGKMTPEEWAILQYKHLDHHLRQFGA